VHFLNPVKFREAIGQMSAVSKFIKLSLVPTLNLFFWQGRLTEFGELTEGKEKEK